MEQVLLSIETPNAPPMTYMVPSGGEISIGRDETCTVVLASPDISRRHVTINIQPSAIVVRDSSSNGTQVGTQRVFRSELPVPYGTPVQVGPYVIRVVRQGANGAAAAGPPGAPNLPPIPGGCIAEDYPENYDEGAHCCADGIWGADIGNGNAEDACAMLGGVCTEE